MRRKRPSRRRRAGESSTSDGGSSQSSSGSTDGPMVRRRRVGSAESQVLAVVLSYLKEERQSKEGRQSGVEVDSRHRPHSVSARPAGLSVSPLPSPAGIACLPLSATLQRYSAEPHRTCPERDIPRRRSKLTSRTAKQHTRGGWADSGWPRPSKTRRPSESRVEGRGNGAWYASRNVSAPFNHTAPKPASLDLQRPGALHSITFGSNGFDRTFGPPQRPIVRW